MKLLKHIQQTALILLATSVVIMAQDLDLNGSASPATKITHTETGNIDIISAYGYSVPSPYYGIGIMGFGSSIGLKGKSELSGIGTRIGVYGTASGGTSSNYGVYGVAYGTNAYAGYFSGNVKYTGSYSTSDLRFKTDIEPAGAALPDLLKLRPTQYYYKHNEFPQLNFSDREQIGFIAQEFGDVYPDLVIPILVMHDADDPQSTHSSYLGIDYKSLLPRIIKGLQEQQVEIKRLERLLRKKLTQHK